MEGWILENWAFDYHTFLGGLCSGFVDHVEN